jgi:hypothetical protein
MNFPFAARLSLPADCCRSKDLLNFCVVGRPAEQPLLMVRAAANPTKKSGRTGEKT